MTDFRAVAPDAPATLITGYDFGDVLASRAAALGASSAKKGTDGVLESLVRQCEATLAVEPALLPVRSFVRKRRPTPREMEVVRLRLSGASRAATAVQLGISEATVAEHSKDVLDKLDAGSFCELACVLLGLCGVAEALGEDGGRGGGDDEGLE